MTEENQKIVILTTKEILLYLVDFAVALHEAFDPRKLYRKTYKDYRKWRRLDRERFSKEIYKLKRKKLIKIYIEGKEKYIELMPKGLDKIKEYKVDDLHIEKPKIWDKKWRIIIFDIPNTKRIIRDILRERLKRLGFIMLQESVFIFPFECKKEIDYIAETYYIKPYLKYILADILEGDIDLIEEFLEKDILSPKIICKEKSSK